MYNPMQTRLDQLNQQKAMIEQQLQMLQQYQMPPININNQIAPSTAGYDFGCKWVNDENEAKSLPNNTIGFSKSEPVFYMSGKKFKFEEVRAEENTNNNNDRLNALESKINAILERLDNAKVNTPTIAEKPVETAKNSRKGANNNE